MNRKVVINTVGKIILIEAVMLLIPVVVGFCYGENVISMCFLSVAAAAAALGCLLSVFVKPKDSVIFAKDGFAIVSLAWLCVSAIGAVPFKVSGEIPSYVDAFFETVSGFTTTGASILTDVESMSHTALFWRSFTHWVGGMGVIVFVMAVIPNISDRSMHIMKAEMPGPVIGKLVPRVKDTAKILYLIYLGMTVVEFVMLVLGGMSVFDSIVHTFGTAGTGGFGIKSNSIGGYSPYLQWVIAIFMLLFGVNFNLYYLILMRKFKIVIKSTELWSYLGIFFVAAGVITLNTLSFYKNSIGTAIRNSVFQVSSIMTTTGYATDNFDLWPGLSKSILLILMVIGACAGSTAGGLKVSRTVMLFKTVKREIRKMLHPHSVTKVRFEGKPVEDETLKGVSVYFAAYMLCAIVIFLLISFEPFSIETNISAVAACFNNIGPGLDAVGPAASYSQYTDFSKIILSVAMLLGRLEIYPLIIAFSPSTWLKK